MRQHNQWLYILIIGIGVIFLLQNLGLLPAVWYRAMPVIWPLLLIAAGIYLLVYLRDRDMRVDWISGQDDFTMRVHVGEKEYEIDDPVVKTMAGIFGAVIGLIITGLVLFGIVGPILIVVFAVVAVAAIIALGIPFLALLIPLAILAAPIILIVWLLGLLV